MKIRHHVANERTKKVLAARNESLDAHQKSKNDRDEIHKCNQEKKVNQ